MSNSSGVGVLDKTVSVLSALENGPASLAQLVKATGLARPTAHRIAVALETHRLLTRDAQGRFVLGPRIGELASAAGEDRLLAVAQPVLLQLRDHTGESAQLYRPHADTRICVAAAERTSGLRDTVPVGAALPMTAGSAAQVLLAWEEGGRMHRGLRGAKFTATTLAQVRRRGWAATAAEREPGVASVSAPVRGPGGRVLAAVSVSGPIERLTRSPGRLHAQAVVAAGDKISKLLRAELPGGATPRNPPVRCAGPGGRPPGTPRCAVLARGGDPPEPPGACAGPGGRPPGTPGALRAPLRWSRRSIARPEGPSAPRGPRDGGAGLAWPRAARRSPALLAVAPRCSP